MTKHVLYLLLGDTEAPLSCIVVTAVDNFLKGIFLHMYEFFMQHVGIIMCSISFVKHLKRYAVQLSGHVKFLNKYIFYKNSFSSLLKCTKKNENTKILDENIIHA